MIERPTISAVFEFKFSLDTPQYRIKSTTLTDTRTIAELRQTHAASRQVIVICKLKVCAASCSLEEREVLSIRVPKSELQDRGLATSAPLLNDAQGARTYGCAAENTESRPPRSGELPGSFSTPLGAVRKPRKSCKRLLVPVSNQIWAKIARSLINAPSCC